MIGAKINDNTSTYTAAVIKTVDLRRANRVRTEGREAAVYTVGDRPIYST